MSLVKFAAALAAIDFLVEELKGPRNNITANDLKLIEGVKPFFNSQVVSVENSIRSLKTLPTITTSDVLWDGRLLSPQIYTIKEKARFTPGMRTQTTHKKVPPARKRTNALESYYDTLMDRKAEVSEIPRVLRTRLQQAQYKSAKDLQDSLEIQLEKQSNLMKTIDPTQYVPKRRPPRRRRQPPPQAAAAPQRNRTMLR
jgi:hypothetical protein